MWFHKKGEMPYKEGLIQALGIGAYVALVATFMSQANRWFGEVDNKFVGPMMFLTLFIVSALVCSLIVFAKPYKLFTEKKGTEALNLVIATTKWLAVMLLLVMGWAILV